MARWEGQRAEWDRPKQALLCEPNIETLFALLAPDAANFVRPFSLFQAQKEHRAFRRLLEANGVWVWDLRQALIENADEQQGGQWLRDFAARYVTHVFDASLSLPDRQHIQERFRETFQALDPFALADLILLRPTVHLAHNPDSLDPTSRFTAKFSVAPVSNSYYLRDPMITTAAGCVIGRLKLAVRQPENEIVAFALARFGITPIYTVQAPGHLEGGDFLPCGDFVLQGQGLLSDVDGVRQCLENRVYGFVEIGVVRDPRSQMDEMHLDTYLTVLDRDVCALCEDRLGADEPVVDIYVPKGTPENFRYSYESSQGFASYLQAKGMEILTFTKAEQEAFAPNGVLLGPRRFVGVKGCGEEFARKLAAAGVETHWLEFSALTGGYGGPHCSSQFLRRERIQPNDA